MRNTRQQVLARRPWRTGAASGVSVPGGSPDKQGVPRLLRRACDRQPAGEGKRHRHGVSDQSDKTPRRRPITSPSMTLFFF